MAAKHNLIYSLKQLVKNNKQGSFQTQSKRTIELIQMAKDLNTGGYKLKHVEGLKPKHIEFLVKLWENRGLSAGTIKNKTSQLRWWANTIHKSGIMKSNDGLGLKKRTYIPTRNKAIHLTSEVFNKVGDSHIQASLQLQYHLGLRREESLKIRPHLADKGDYLELQGSWCKGGRARQIPILTPEARAAVDFAKLQVQSSQDSLIPKNKTYIAHKHFYEHKTSEAGIKNPHGLRHAYAQRRYEILTGWASPIAGGPSYKSLTAEEKHCDYAARMQISEELGHSRVNITVNYLGR